MSRGPLHDRSFAFSVRDSDPSPVVGDVPQGIVSQSLELDRAIARRSVDATMPPPGVVAARERLAFVAQVLVGYNVEVTVRIGCPFLLPRQRSRVATTLISIDHTAFSSQKIVPRATIG